MSWIIRSRLLSRSLPSWERGLKSFFNNPSSNIASVAPFVGAWIEISYCPLFHTIGVVAPFVGAWIEMQNTVYCYMSLHVAPFVGAWIEIRKLSKFVVSGRVAPFVGAWIEIICNEWRNSFSTVAPFVGAWIEISSIVFLRIFSISSLPSWERGLKYSSALCSGGLPCRSLRGSVD